MLFKAKLQRRIRIVAGLARLGWAEAAGAWRRCWKQKRAVNERVAAHLVAAYKLAPRPEEVTVGPRRLTYGWALTRPDEFGQQAAVIADSDGRRRAVIDIYLN